MFDWDDLRIFVAAARGGSFSAAARQVGVDAATVGRRIARFETALKATLFTRSPAGLQLTATGARVLEEGLRAEAAMDAALRVGEPDLVGGVIRLSVSEGFGAAIVAPALPALRAQRPALRVELAAASGFLSPTKREVDMTVTLIAPTSPRLDVQPLTEYELGLYAARAYLARAPLPAAPADLPAHDIVGYVDDLIYAPALRYLDEVHPGLTPSLGSSSILSQAAIIAAGGGIGVLPCFLGAGLVRVLPDQVRLRRRFWTAVRRDVTDTARIRLLRSWLQEVVRVRRGDLTPSG
jgi:DNA-binding transcriptional LysR family regulator